MNVIFGIWNLDSAPASELDLSTMGTSTQRFAPDGCLVHTQSNIGFAVQNLHTGGGVRGNGFGSSARGSMIALNGRIDNRRELLKTVDTDQEDISDALLVLLCFERCGAEIFGKLVGDWAMALWSQTERALYLARDHAGTRTLFYERSEKRLIFSTYLDPFIAIGKGRRLDRAYVAEYLSGERRSAVRTPYEGVSSVSPGQYVWCSALKVEARRHWAWPWGSKLSYRNDADYEEEFLSRFRIAVARRSNPDDPAVAELSGGRDSSAIVCVADTQREHSARVPSLRTISYFDDEDPDWDERPYFELVERHRGRTGVRLPISLATRTFTWSQSPAILCPLPGPDDGGLRDQIRYQETVGPECRVLISGIGGDELLAGAPVPALEIADALASGSLGVFCTQSMTWAIHQRRPVYGLALEAVKLAGRATLGNSRKAPLHAAWWTPGFEHAVRCSSYDLEPHRRRLPSMHRAASTWSNLVASLPHLTHSPVCRYEYRYPFLDRDLVEFLARVPRAQLLRPGQHRSLMRRALKGIVPEEVLERRRKAFLSRGLIVGLIRARDALLADRPHWPHRPSSEFFDLPKLAAALGAAIQGDTTESWIALHRSVVFKTWIDECIPRMGLRMTSEHRT